jgi:organic hydroperoxide reductase OsmC/OhrA
MLTTEDRAFEIAAHLDVVIRGIDDAAQAAELVAAAHQVCPYSRATRGNMDVSLTANGAPVG